MSSELTTLWQKQQLNCISFFMWNQFNRWWLVPNGMGRAVDQSNCDLTPTCR
jgi:hypothetical protein